MKYVLLAVVLLVAVWWLRGKVARLRDAQDESPAEGSKPAAKTRRSVEAMVACARCGVHVGFSEVVRGRHGSYCSEEHRRAAEPG